MIFFPIICAFLFIALPRIISAAPVSGFRFDDNNTSVDYEEQSALNKVLEDLSGETESNDEEGNYDDEEGNYDDEEGNYDDAEGNYDYDYNYAGNDKYINNPLFALSNPNAYQGARSRSRWFQIPQNKTKNYEDNDGSNPQSIVQSMLQNNGDAVHIERTQGFNGVSDYQPPANNNNNNQPTGLEIEVEHPPQSGETESNDEEGNYDDDEGNYNDDEGNYNYYYAGDDKYINNPSSGETESEDKGSNYDINRGININIKINNPKSE